MNAAKEKMLERVRALLAKTVGNGCTEGEAMLALAKARQLMAEYEITESEAVFDPNAERATVEDMGPDDPYSIKGYLSGSISKFTRTKTWRSRPGYGRNYTKVNYCGLESEVPFAIWLTDMLTEFVLRELKKFKADRRSKGLRSNRRISSSFVMGCIARIGVRLQELTPQDPVGSGLVVCRNALIDEKMAALGLNLRDSSVRRCMDPQSYHAGHAAGANANFSRPVGGGGPLRLT